MAYTQHESMVVSGEDRLIGPFGGTTIGAFVGVALLMRELTAPLWTLGLGGQIAQAVLILLGAVGAALATVRWHGQSPIDRLTLWVGFVGRRAARQDTLAPVAVPHSRALTRTLMVRRDGRTLVATDDDGDGGTDD